MLKEIFIMISFIVNSFVCIGVADGSNIKESENLNYSIEERSNIVVDEIDNNPIFYIMSDLDKKQGEDNGTQLGLSLIEQKLELGIYYNFKYLSKHYKGKVYVNSSSTKEYLKEKIRFIFETIENKTYFKETSNFSSNYFSISSNWKLIDSEKTIIDCTYNNEYFGDVIELRTAYKLDCDNKKYSFLAVIKDLNFIPNVKKTDYRMDEFIDSIYSKDNETNFISYGPRIKNNSEFIEYSINVGKNIVDMNGNILSSDIYCKYNTLLKSPSIRNQSNLIKNKVEIEFDYLFPFDNSGEYYEYNISPSYQCISLITKIPNNYQKLVLTNDKTIKIQRDGFWSNLLGVFTVSSDIIINN